MKVYVLVITDVEIDGVPTVFLREEDAINYARSKIRSFALEHQFNYCDRDEALKDFERCKYTRLGSLDIALYVREVNE